MVYQPISFLVFGKLATPKRAIALRHGRVFWAAVPKATVHKNRQMGFAEYEVWFTKVFLMPSPAFATVFAKKFRERQFRSLVPAAANARHYF